MMSIPNSAAQPVVASEEDDVNSGERAGETTRRPSLKLNALSNLAVMGLGILIAFFITPAMLDYLGEARYGMWTLTSSLVGYFGLLQFGLTSSVFRYVPHYRAKREQDRVSAVVSTSMAFYSVAGAVIFALMLTLDGPVARFFGGGKELAGLIAVVALAFALDLPSLILNAAVKGYEGFAFVNIATALTLVLRGGLLMGCVWLGYDLIAMGWCLVIVRVVSLLMQWVAFRRTCRGVHVHWRFVSWSELRVLLVFGSVILVAGTANALAVEAPKQIVGKLVSLEALGIFGIPVMMVGYFRQVIFNLTRVLSPRFSYLSAKQSDRQIATLFLRSSRYVAMIVSGLAVLAWISGPSFLLLWTRRPQMEQAVPALLVLLLGNMTLLSHRVSSDLLLAVGKERLLAVFEMSEALAILVLTGALSLKFGITGAACGMAIPFVIVRSVFQPVYVCQVVGVSLWEYYRKSIVRPWALAVALCVLAWLTGASANQTRWISLTVVTALFLAAYALLVYAFVLTQTERQAVKDKVPRVLRW